MSWEDRVRRGRLLDQVDATTTEDLGIYLDFVEYAPPDQRIYLKVVNIARLLRRLQSLEIAHGLLKDHAAGVEKDLRDEREGSIVTLDGVEYRLAAAPRFCVITGEETRVWTYRAVGGSWWMIGKCVCHHTIDGRRVT